MSADSTRNPDDEGNLPLAAEFSSSAGLESQAASHGLSTPSKTIPLLHEIFDTQNHRRWVFLSLELLDDHFGIDSVAIDSQRVDPRERSKRRDLRHWTWRIVDDAGRQYRFEEMSARSGADGIAIARWRFSPAIAEDARQLVLELDLGTSSAPSVWRLPLET